MSELISDHWKSEEEESSCCHHSRAPRKGPVTDILLWVECYSTLVAVLATKYPAKVPQLLAYQRRIIRSYKKYAGQGWITYDVSYRHSAANTKSLDWDKLDSDLYNETFTGRAKAIPRCAHCSSELHTTSQCPQGPATPSMYQPPPMTSRVFIHDIPVCFDFNHESGNKCKFKWCKFAHICINCRGRHPKSNCPQVSQGRKSRKAPHKSHR